MDTIKTDDYKRLRIPHAQPGSVYSYFPNPDGSILLTPVIEKEVAVINPVRRKDGSYRWPVKLSREQIRAAIRADRDES